MPMGGGPNNTDRNKQPSTSSGPGYSYAENGKYIPATRTFGPFSPFREGGARDKYVKEQAYRQDLQKRTDDAMTSLRNQAANFRKNKDKYVWDQYEPVVNQAQYGLKDTEEQTQRSFARRGLGQGPQMAAALVSTRTQVASQLSNLRKQLNDEAQSIAHEMDLSVGRARLKQGSDRLQIARELYNSNRELAAAQRQASGNLSAAIGSGLGSYLGYRADQGADVGGNNGLVAREYVGPMNRLGQPIR